MAASIARAPKPCYLSRQRLNQEWVFFDAMEDCQQLVARAFRAECTPQFERILFCQAMQLMPEATRQQAAIHFVFQICRIKPRADQNA